MKASAAAMRVGYESASQFSREFKRYFGVTPGGRCGKNAGDAGELNTFRYSNRERGKIVRRLQYFF
ncbi:hypothetical protein [Escherichia coli ISC41]|nr:hypothetical protein [Escherichia coli ISC41]